jgi:DNA polymerase-3 subunit gamma/tau
MSYQVLARKWRPKTFSQLAGQEAVVQALVNGLDNDRVHHGFVLTGTRGVGKTTIARILAKCLNCETGVTSTPCGECSSCVEIDEGRYPDMQEVDAASRTGVDDMRELLESAHYAPARGRYKVYIIDEVHMLSKHSFNALLKTLEEPPAHVKFVLATTNPEAIPVTVLSRCLRFNLRRLLPDEISAYINHILAEEGIEADASAVQRIARGADGSMRDGLSLLDQAIAYGAGRIVDEDVAQMMGSVDHAHIAHIIEALAAEDAMRLLDIVRELTAQARDFERVMEELAEVLHRMALLQLVPDYRDPERSDWESVQSLAGQLSAEDVQLFYQVAVQGKRDLGLAPDPRTGLEMSLLRMLAFRPASAGAVSSAPAAAAQGSGSKAKPAAKAQLASKAAAHETGGQGAAASTTSPEAWQSMAAALSLSGPARELARNITLESCAGQEWRFLIPHEVEHLGSSALVQQLQSALSAQVGHAVQLAIHTATGPVATPAAISEQAEVRRASEAEKAINDDPTVRALKERFNARIIEDSIQPLQ